MNQFAMNEFSARQFMSNVSGSAGGEYAQWFFERVRDLTKVLEQRLDEAERFETDDVAGTFLRTAADLAVLDTMLKQLEGHCKNLQHYKTAITNARLKIAALLTSNKAYIDAARGVDNING